MDCRDARNLILRSEGPAEGAAGRPPRRCDPCPARRRPRPGRGRLAGDPAPRRGRPGPPGFLARLATRPGGGPAPAGGPLRRWLVAASVLVGLGLWGGVLASGGGAGASSDVVERLVEWNLDLARVESPGRPGPALRRPGPDAGGRGRAGGAAGRGPRAGRRPPGERPLARPERRPAGRGRPLPRPGRPDPRPDERRHGGGDGRRVERFARLYNRVVELGIGSKFDVLEESAALDFERQRRLQAPGPPRLRPDEGPGRPAGEGARLVAEGDQEGPRDRPTSQAADAERPQARGKNRKPKAVDRPAAEGIRLTKPPPARSLRSKADRIRHPDTEPIDEPIRTRRPVRIRPVAREAGSRPGRSRGRSRRSIPRRGRSS